MRRLWENFLRLLPRRRIQSDEVEVEFPPPAPPADTDGGSVEELMSEPTQGLRIAPQSRSVVCEHCGAEVRGALVNADGRRVAWLCGACVRSFGDTWHLSENDIKALRQHRVLEHLIRNGHDRCPSCKEVRRNDEPVLTWAEAQYNSVGGDAVCDPCKETAVR